MILEILGPLFKRFFCYIVKNEKLTISYPFITILISYNKSKTTPELLDSYCENISYSNLIKELKTKKEIDTLLELNFGVWQVRDIIGSYRENIFWSK